MLKHPHFKSVRMLTSSAYKIVDSQSVLRDYAIRLLLALLLWDLTPVFELVHRWATGDIIAIAHECQRHETSCQVWGCVTLNYTGLDKPNRNNQVSKAAPKLLLQVMLSKDIVERWVKAEKHFGAAGRIVPFRREVSYLNFLFARVSVRDRFLQRATDFTAEACACLLISAAITQI